jgi:glucosyl-dolichyl phosphate glucuronosyltransferase
MASSNESSLQPPPDLLSIVICTHNRATDVLECVDTLLPQLATTNVDLLVVDSASDPEQAATLREGLLLRPSARLLRLERSGLSEARNAGIAATSGRWVAFLDDDAVPSPIWLAELVAVLNRVPETCGAVGGQILPIYPAGPIPEMGKRWKMYLSLNESSGERDCTDRFELIAANCCFRRSAIEQVDNFPLGLGRFGNVLLSGEDVLLMFLLRKHGWRIRYHDQFSVGHKIPRQRLHLRWVLNRAYWEGITTVRMNAVLNQSGRLRLVGKSLMVTPLLFIMSLRDSPDREWKLRLWFSLGIIAETFGFGFKNK